MEIVISIDKVYTELKAGEHLILGINWNQRHEHSQEFSSAVFLPFSVSASTVSFTLKTNFHFISVPCGKTNKETSK